MRFVSCLLLVSCAVPFRTAKPDDALTQGRTEWTRGALLTPKRPLNVVLIVADDLGRSDVSTYGTQGPRISTPSIDALAQQGVAYEAGYVTAPICSPSRAGLLTGRYQQRFGHEGQPHERYAKNALEYFVFKSFVADGDWLLKRRADPSPDDIERAGLPVTELTLADLLKREGYATGIFGKWHLGWNQASQPNQRGFDQHYGFYEAYSLYADEQRDDVVNQHHDDFSERFIWGKGRTGTAAIRRNDTVIDEPGYLTDRIADETIAFIDENQTRPFFAYVPFSAPHTPFQALKKDVERFADEPDPNRRVYLALVASLDRAVGRIVSALDERHLADDTLVIFVSDNGGALYTHATTNAPLRGGKFTLFEGGIRVPFVMRWPGQIPAGSKYAPPVSTLDVVATVAAAIGLELPADRPYDGVDLLPYLNGKPGAPHDTLYWRAEYTAAIRRGPHKLIRDLMSGHRKLFDLENDPGESNDLSATSPALVEALDAALDDFETRQCREPLWPHIMEYRHTEPDGLEWWYPL